MNKIAGIVTELARPVAERQGVEIWDVDYVKEGGAWVLRVYIDKAEGIGIDDCERFSRELDPILDEADPIEDSYTFEVSSAGAERELKRPSDFERFLGHKVEVRLYRSVDGGKEHIGLLQSYDNGDVSLLKGNKTFVFPKDNVALVRLRV